MYQNVVPTYPMMSQFLLNETFAVLFYCENNDLTNVVEVKKAQGKLLKNVMKNY